MKILIHTIKPFLLSLMLGIPFYVHAEEVELCAPFKDAPISQNVLATMLQAAEDGNLYRVKPNTSKMGICINSPVGKVEVEFSDFKGGLILKEKGQHGQTMMSIAVDSLSTDSYVIQTMLKGESFLDSERYPNITFVSTGIEWLTDTKAVLKGNLSMHGVTKAVAFYVDMHKLKSHEGEDIVTVKATTTIQRSQFNMFTLSPMIDDRVSLCMTIDAYRYKA